MRDYLHQFPLCHCPTSTDIPPADMPPADMPPATTTRYPNWALRLSLYQWS
ncbi:MAG: hypothetical protein IGS54_03020 [Elainella sp. C42_A2020_010]|nr:hypothetical protein [Elainella sp. C42_A2020_010]